MPRMRFSSIVFGLSVALAGAPAALLAGADASPHVTARLISDVARIAPSTSFRVGLHLKIDPQWHVYWKNPGDGGLPTTVRWALPEGFTVSQLKFPLPALFVQPGDIQGIGYEDEVVVLATITPPANLPAGPLVIKADASWLVCRDQCLPGEASLRLEFLAAESGAVSARSADADLVEAWAKRLPVAVDDSEAVRSVELSGGLTEGSVIARLAWARGVKDIRAFAYAPEQVGLGHVRIDSAGTSVAVPVRLYGGQKLPAGASLELVIVYQDADGKRKGVAVTTPLLAR